MPVIIYGQQQKDKGITHMYKTIGQLEKKREIRQTYVDPGLVVLLLFYSTLLYSALKS